MKFIEAAKLTLEKNNNKPMSSNEIWEEIKYIVETDGKTPKNSLNAMLLGQCVNSTLNKFNIKNKKIFTIVGRNPMKFKLANFVPDNVKNSLIDSGFITMEILKDIFKKNGLNI